MNGADLDFYFSPKAKVNKEALCHIYVLVYVCKDSVCTYLAIFPSTLILWLASLVFSEYRNLIIYTAFGLLPF